MARSSAELLQLAAHGDEAAREELLEKHRERLTRMVASQMDVRLARRIDASDVVQEATIEAARRLPEFMERPSVDFYVWLRWIARERLIDMRREHLGTQKRDARRELHRVSGEEHSAVELAKILVSDLTSPSGNVQRNQQRQAVRDALDRLDSKDHEILVLRHYEQLSLSQVAEVLGMSKSGVGRRHISALRQLKAALNPSFTSDDV